MSQLNEAQLNDPFKLIRENLPKGMVLMSMEVNIEEARRPRALLLQELSDGLHPIFAPSNQSR